MFKPKEDLPECKNLAQFLDGGVIEGARVHENSLVILSSKKKVLYIKNLNEWEVTTICDKYSGILGFPRRYR